MILISRIGTRIGMKLLIGMQDYNINKCLLPIRCWLVQSHASFYKIILLQELQLR